VSTVQTVVNETETNFN